jgi:NAD(P)-dependent dehydrogenase (short-subunit alcohol dehydrogenase family)
VLDNNRLDGKVALVTGAGGEIGAAAIRLMAARGARIVAVDRDADALLRLSSTLPNLDLITCEADVTDEDAVRRYVGYAQSQTGRIDIFFNNAGIEGPVCTIAEYPLANFRRVIDVNVIGVFLGLKHVIPAMQATGGASMRSSD